jgi:hypothetical protein
MKRPRLAVSNISDCSDVVSVYDYANPPQIKLVKTFSAADLGYDGSTPLKTCDATGKIGLMLSPHGTGTSAATGRVYHFLTGTGQIAVFDIDADVPTVKLIQTAGSGGASVKDLPGGRFMVVPQRGPREVHQRADGSLCQVGQLAVVDAMAEKVVAQLPVFYGEPDCRTSIAGQPHERAALQYAMPSPDGKTVFVEIGTLYGSPNVVAGPGSLPSLICPIHTDRSSCPRFPLVPATIPEITRSQVTASCFWFPTAWITRFRSSTSDRGKSHARFPR